MRIPRPKLNSRTLFWGGAAIAILLVLIWAFRPQAVSVDMAEVSRGPLTVTVRDEGRTRARDVYVVSSPLAGRLLRIGNRAGEQVSAGEVVAVIRPGDPVLLDERTRREAQAAERSAASAVTLAGAEVEGAEARLAHARAEAARTETLFADNVASRSALDRARLDLRTAEAALETARAAVSVRRAELEAARIRLTGPAHATASGRTVDIRAPVSGRVLRMVQENESVVPAGAPILEIGDAGDLEVVAEFLSSDAVRIEPGAAVLIDAWGGGAPLRGRVRQVEPYGFLKISALGVEEQRVNVIIDLDEPSGEAAALGHGYRVEAAVTVWHEDAVIRAPVAALFRQQGRWAVFRVENGRARLRLVDVGRNDGVLAEIHSGLEPGDRVVLHPGQSVSDGTRLRRRDAG